MLGEDRALRAADFTATTDEDRPCRLMPASEVTEELAVGAGLVVAELRLPRGLDIELGYAVVLKKLRTVVGVREAVTATLDGAHAAGSTSLAVSTHLGFEPGDNCVMNGWAFRVASAEDDELGLYADEALEDTQDDGELIEAKTLWIATSGIRPQAVRGPINCRIQQQAGWWPQ